MSRCCRPKYTPDFPLKREVVKSITATIQRVTRVSGTSRVSMLTNAITMVTAELIT